jgi:tetratricopeptide (TPR) repeat protein
MGGSYSLNSALFLQVCVFKAMGDRQRQAEELNAVLKQFPGESSSWAELGDLYLSLCDLPVRSVWQCSLTLAHVTRIPPLLQAAAHCFEELVLLNPISAHHHVRLAEVYYSMGEQSTTSCCPRLLQRPPMV